MAQRPAWRSHVLALGLYALSGLLFAWPLPLHLFTRLPGRITGDTGVYVWNLWVFRYELFEGGHLPFATSRIFSSDLPADLSLHNYTVFADLLALPVLPLVGPVAAYNLVWILLTVIGACAMYLLVLDILRERQTSSTGFDDGRVAWVAAWMAGLLFAYSPALVARSTEHLSLLIGAPLAAFTATWLRALRTGQKRWGAASGLMMAWAMTSDPYYGVYCLMIGGFFLVAERVDISWARRRASTVTRWSGLALIALALPAAMVYAWIVATGGGEFWILGMLVRTRTTYTPALILTVLLLGLAATFVRLRAVPRRPIGLGRDVLLIATAGASASLAASPLLWVLGKRMLEGRWVDAPVLWRSSMPGVDLLAFLMPNPNSPWFGRLFKLYLTGLPGGFAENVASLTLVAIGVVLFAVARDRLRLPGSWLALTLLSASLAAGPFLIIGSFNTGIPTPWTLLRYLPLIGGARAPARFTAVAMLGASVLFAVALREVLARRPGRLRLIGALVCGALIFELSPAPRQIHSAEVPSIYRTVAADPRPVLVLELPFGLRDGVSSTGDYSAASQFYQTFHRKRLMGGYLSRVSPERKERARRAPLRGALIRLSEGKTVPPGLAVELSRTVHPAWRERLGYVVIDRTRATPALVDFAIQALDLEKIGESEDRDLYRPRSPATGNAPAELTRAGGPAATRQP